jgi:pyruvate kinase
VHRTNVQRVREAAGELGRNVGILQDLQGPKIRVGKFADQKVTLARASRSR